MPAKPIDQSVEPIHRLATCYHPMWYVTTGAQKTILANSTSQTEHSLSGIFWDSCTSVIYQSWYFCLFLAVGHTSTHTRLSQGPVASFISNARVVVLGEP